MTTSVRAAAPGDTAVGATLPVRKNRYRRRRRRVALLFMLPALAVNALVIAGPGASSLYYAFTDWNGLGAAHWTGLDNANHLIHDPDFWNAIRHNAIYLVFFLTVPIVMGLAGATMLSRLRKGVAPFRLIFFLPYLIASVVNAQVWKNLLDPTAGIAAQLDKLGLHFLDNVFFLGDPKLSLYSVAFVDNWHFWGFLVVLFLAAMQGIDPARYEAARIDGANAWQEFWHITLPGIRPTLIFAVMIISLWSLLAFDYAYVLTGGGPAGSSDLVSLLVNRTAFESLDAGYAAFMALAMSVLGGIFLVIFTVMNRNQGDES